MHTHAPSINTYLDEWLVLMPMRIESRSAV